MVAGTALSFSEFRTGWCSTFFQKYFKESAAPTFLLKNFVVVGTALSLSGIQEKVVQCFLQQNIFREESAVLSLVSLGSIDF